MPPNYDYSRTHGGCPKAFPDSIKDAFYFIENNALPRNNNGYSNGSAHFLYDVREYLKNKWGWPSNVDLINPCLGCHDPHRAKKDWPCSLPSGHEDVHTWEVWGDDSGEKMATAGSRGVSGTYQPPYKLGKTQYEWTDANVAPDYVYLCSECHYSMQHGFPEPYSTRKGVRLTQVNFYAQGGHHHGSGHDGPGLHGKKREPYDDNTNYVLMCTDCHEPHGSANYMLLRTCVNGYRGPGGTGISVTGPTDNEGWIDFCDACHEGDFKTPGAHLGGFCSNCHGHSEDHF